LKDAGIPENPKLIAFGQHRRAGGKSAIPHNKSGKGNAFYVATVPNQSGMEWLIENVCKSADTQPVAANAPAALNFCSAWMESHRFCAC